MRHKLVLTLIASVAVCWPTYASDPIDEARQAVDSYDIEVASDLLDQIEAKASRNRKARLTESQQAEIDELRSRIVTLNNMLQRVEQITIIDSLQFDLNDFFLNFKLSPEAGRITKSTGREADSATVAFIPESAREILWASEDSNGVSHIWNADILDDGTVENSQQLDLGFDEFTDVSFPFLMADGVSLYFSGKGDQSIGGYDIFMTRRNGQGRYTMPQNIGMPYNSPYNDYMLAIDENTGLGWWATDRNAPDGKVTVYIFIPSETRVNYSPDRADLASLARIDQISVTWQAGEDYSKLLSRLAKVTDAKRAESKPMFMFAAGGKVYTQLNELPNADARRAMTELMALQRGYDQSEAKLADLRERYRKGDHSLAKEILDLEQRLTDDARELARVRNEVARAASR